MRDIINWIKFRLNQFGRDPNYGWDALGFGRAQTQKKLFGRKKKKKKGRRCMIAMRGYNHPITCANYSCFF
jgi:hypothetical protein